MKKLVLVIAAFMVISSAGAQTLKSYLLMLAENTDTTVEKIYVEPFQKSDPLAETVLPNFGTDIAKYIQNEITDSERYGNVEHIPSAWLRSDIYEVAENESEADWILTGDYLFKAKEVRDQSVEIKEEKQDAENIYRIPYEVEYFNYSNHLDVEVSFELKDQSGKVITSNEWEESYASNPGKTTMNPMSKLKSFKQLANLSGFGNAISNHFLPFFDAVTYEFRNIRNRDLRQNLPRDRFKELRKAKRDADNYARDLDYYSLGGLYKTIAEEAEIEDAIYNMGMVYEIIGNYTRAKECYQQVGAEKDLQRIDYAIAMREILAAFGKEYFEPEL